MPVTMVESRNDASPTSEAEAPVTRRGTHGQVLKSSAMVGGAQIANIGIGIVRTKAMAMMLGPGGFGLFGLYSSIVSLAQTMAGLGVNSSGVRQIAAAMSTGDERRIAETVIVLRRVSLLLGAIGAGLMVLFSRQISTLTFGNAAHARAVSWLAIAMSVTLVSASQTALVQGMRRIADLAKIQVLGALLGALMGIPLVYFFREDGVVPSLICVAATTLITSWWYSRRASRPGRELLRGATLQMRAEALSLLKLGVAFMMSSLITLGVAYAIRITILRKLGVEATGLYQSAWTLGGLYVGIILQAMGADFYPRLTGVAHDNAECNRLVNDQTHVGILLAGPGVLATITLAPLVIELFYSGKFGAAVPILRWICLGAMLQVISYPLGYIIIAKAKRGLFIGAEVAWGVISVALSWVCINNFGLPGIGMAYLGSYAFHAVMLYVIARRITDFRWSAESRTIGALCLSTIFAVFVGFYLLPFWWSVLLGILLTLVHIIYSLKTLVSFFHPDQYPGAVSKALRLLRLVPRTS